MLKLKRLFFILICFFSLVITANTARAFLPSLETIEQAWQENYSSLESFACLITWENYPDLTTRVWFKKGNTLVEWGIKKEQEQIFGAVLFQKEQQVLSSFDFTSPLPFVVYFFIPLPSGSNLEWILRKADMFFGRINLAWNWEKVHEGFIT